MRRPGHARARLPRQIRQGGPTTNCTNSPPPNLAGRAISLTSLLPCPPRPSTSFAATLVLPPSRPVSIVATATNLLPGRLAAPDTIAAPDAAVVRLVILGLHLAIYVFDKLFDQFFVILLLEMMDSDGSSDEEYGNTELDELMPKEFFDSFKFDEDVVMLMMMSI